MKKEKLYLIICVVVFITGIFILMNSINFGNKEGSAILQEHNGVMDTKIYLIYLEQAIVKYRTLGSILSILSGIGGLGVIKNKIRMDQLDQRICHGAMKEEVDTGNSNS